jgi:hypothetical protein
MWVLIFQSGYKVVDYMATLRRIPLKQMVHRHCGSASYICLETYIALNLPKVWDFLNRHINLTLGLPTLRGNVVYQRGEGGVKKAHQLLINISTTPW